MTRRKNIALPQGYAVLAIPDTGLYVRNGKLETGHGTETRFSEIMLFSRISDAHRHAWQMKDQWAKVENGHTWDFPVVPVLVRERL